MKHLCVDFVNGDKIEFHYDSIMQICGHHDQYKRRLFHAFRQFFSGKKAAGLPECSISMDSAVLSSNHYKVFSIFNELDLINELTYGKDSLFFETVKGFESNHDFCVMLELVNNDLLKLDGLIEAHLFEIFGYEFIVESKEITVSEYFKSHIKLKYKGIDLEGLSNYNRFVLFFLMLRKQAFSRPDSYLVSIYDVDKFLNMEEFDSLKPLLVDLCENYGVSFLLFSNLAGYIVNDASYVEGITVINDIIFSFSELSLLRESIVRNYPSNIFLDDFVVFKFIRCCAADLFFHGYMYGYTRNDVIIKLLNSFYGVSCSLGEEELVGALELAFLKG